jgi:catechol 2,3-dioxygenase-like lactoylglutathione lyase family enzyme
MEMLANIDVDDLDKAISFYCAAFGLSIGRRFGRFGAELIGGSAPIYLLVKAPGTPAASTISQLRSYERHWAPVHLDFVVEDVELAVQSAIEAGAQLEDKVETHNWVALLTWPTLLVTDSALSSSLGAATTKSPNKALQPTVPP